MSVPSIYAARTPALTAPDLRSQPDTARGDDTMTASPETLTDCLCPSDCGCHPHNGRANVCGCRGHEARAPRFYRVERGWVRYDERHGHAVHVRDDRDRTPEHAMYPRGYDSRCGWCWHGYTHSEAEHAHRLGAVTA